MAQKADPQVLAHLEWLGYVQPTGLVVAAHAMISAGAILDRADIEGQRLLRSVVAEKTGENPDETVHVIPNFAAFAQDVLGWSLDSRFYAGMAANPVPAELEADLADHGETLRPDFAVREPDGQGTGWQLLVSVVGQDVDLDRAYRGHGSYEASPHSRLERLLREKEVLAGLLTNGRTVRLISAPRGETSGWIDFRVEDMLPTAGRPICSALRLLLGQPRLLSLPRHQRLTSLLEESRKYQNLVSERLAEQVLHALYELLRGFQAAQDASKGTLLRSQLESHPDEVYRGLLNVILRMVFLLYAEERDMFPDVETWTRYYSLGGLHERLREDAALHPDTMDQRYGAWAQLLTLFRLVHGGADLGTVRIPARHGVIFDPARFPFLEGRQPGGAPLGDDRLDVPLVSDGTVFRALEKLLVLDGERISYRALDVEQIGSVYETMMGFRLETATGQSLAIRAQKRGGAPTTVDLDALLAAVSGERGKRLTELTGRKLTERVANEVREAASIEGLHAALLGIADLDAAPDIVPRGSLILQPSEERRKSGSHYTPRSLTEPVVRRTLEPVLADLRGQGSQPPQPSAILELKVCDPAMGSGAFLVEACRQLADELVGAWAAHGGRPALPADEDEVVFARRLVAQRCLYGVDRNPMATDLAKVSLWLVTLAREHPLTFLDHAMRHGDSLVGLSNHQIEVFHWDAGPKRVQRGFEGLRIRDHLDRARLLRDQIRQADEAADASSLEPLWKDVAAELREVRLAADLVVAAFLTGATTRDREANRARFADDVAHGQAIQHEDWLASQRGADRPIVPFHWELEFPEVFGRANPGFDAFVGNPPFMGGRSITSNGGEAYAAWLALLHRGSSGGADLVSHFFRRAFGLLRADGAFGLIATNTIGQGDTRASGLRWICNSGGDIFEAQRRLKWPGQAAVVVSVVWVLKGEARLQRYLDGTPVGRITAFLFHRGGNDDPRRLEANAGQSLQGSIVLGMGFTFEATDGSGDANAITVLDDALRRNPRNAEVIFPFIGGEELNSSPTHAPDRQIIDFGERAEAECRRLYPELMAIVEAKVRPERIRKDGVKYPRMVHEWWKYWNPRPELYAKLRNLSRTIAISSVSQHTCFAFLPTGMVYSHALMLFPFETYAALAALQSRVHEVWARFFGSSLEDRLRYNGSDCFESFPLPDGWTTAPRLEVAGRAYHEYRAALMVRTGLGLTKTYNRFVNPEETSPEIVRLRELHSAMDRAVLDAYGWNDIPVDCEFLLDYESDDEDAGRKKPWRHRWPDDVRDEVLARLLELNAARAKEEERAGASRRQQASARRKATSEPTGMDTLF